MKKSKYTFQFLGGLISVWAFRKEEAEILAKAEAITNGWDYTVLSYTKHST